MRDDLPPSPPSDAQPASNLSPRHLTLQHFVQPERLIGSFSPQNMDVRVPRNLDLWPPAAIFDFFYGCAALKRWGPRASLDLISEVSGMNYYNDYSGEEEKSDESDEGNQQAQLDVNLSLSTRAERAERRNAAKDNRRNNEGNVDVMDLVFYLWRRSAPARPKPRASPDESLRDTTLAWVREHQL